MSRLLGFVLVALAVGSCGKETQCTADQQNCFGECVSTTVDERNCGACGTRCGRGQLCLAGQCSAPTCGDTMIDPSNCGACGTVCVPWSTCVAGECTGWDDPRIPVCVDGEVPCGTQTGGVECADTTSDPEHCGGCAIACDDGQICVDSECVAGASDDLGVVEGDLLGITNDLTGAASNDLLSSTSDMLPPPVALVIWVGSNSHDGDLGGRSGADALCGSPPSGVTGGHALVSIGASDEIRDMPTTYSLPTDRIIVGPNEVKIADNWADLLDGTIDVTLATAGIGVTAWSGSDNSGALSGDNCNGFASASGSNSGEQGDSASTTNWLSRASMSTETCNKKNAVLCIGVRN